MQLKEELIFTFQNRPSLKSLCAMMQGNGRESIILRVIALVASQHRQASLRLVLARQPAIRIALIILVTRGVAMATPLSDVPIRRE